VNDAPVWVTPLAVGALGLAVVLIMAFTRYRSWQQAKTDAEERKALIQKGVQQGVLNEYGEPLCRICGQVATKRPVKTGRSWFDQLPFFRGLNRLYAMPMRYSVVEEREAHPQLCSAHRSAAEQRLEHFHATLRSEHSRFNADQEQKVEMMNQGGLLQLLREDSERIRQHIGLGITRPRKVLDSASQLGRPDLHVLPAQSTDVEGEDA
jgi:hypothetical protein